MIFFIHMPKTGGSSIREMIKEGYPDRFVDCYNRDLRDIVSDIEAIGNNAICYGHMAYGIHNYLPRYDVKYYCILRDPVDRVLSDFIYVRDTTPGHPTHDKLQGYSLADAIIEDRYAQLKNCYMRFLLDKGEFSNKDYYTAIGILNNFSFIGNFSRYEETVEMLRQLGVLPMGIELKHEKKQVKEYKMEDRDMGVLLATNQYDIGLWKYYLENLEGKHMLMK